MSTVAARLNLDGRPVDATALEAMLNVQAHRGPGRKAVWTKDVIGVAHGANPIADHTPYPLEEDGLVLVADLRLDNRDELSRVLGVVAPPDQDGPLVLAAYRRWGTHCVRHLRGDFAFILWDAPERRLFAARDIFGVRALFYHHAPGKHLVLSSEIKGLWCHPEIPRALDEVRLAETIQLVDTDVTRTMFADVWALHAGHTLVVQDGRMTTSRYWSTYEVPAWHGGTSDEAYADELLSRLMTAVQRRMRGTEGVGVELSGGLDSSTLAVLAREVRLRDGGPPVDTLSLRYPEYPEADEGTYIDAVLGKGHFNPHMMNGGGRSTLTDIDTVLKVMDDPGLVAGNHHHVWMRLELAKANNLNVVLTGYDGDSIIGHGFERYHEFAQAGEWEAFRSEAETFHQRLLDSGSGPGDQIYLSFPIVLQAYGIGHLRLAAEHSEYGTFARVLAGLHKHFGLPWRTLLGRFAKRLVTPHALVNARQKARFKISPLIRDDLAARTNLKDRAAEVELNRQVWPRTSQAQQLAHLHTPLFLRTAEGLDLYGSAFGIETRHPFLDQDLVEFCLHLPSSQRLRDGWTRLVMRNALKGVLPDLVRLRPGKTSFAAASSQAMVQLDRAHIEAAIQDPGMLGQYLDISYGREVLGRPPEEMGQDAIRLASIVSISRWMKSKLD